MKQYALLFRMDITSKEAQPSKEQMGTYMQQWAEWTDGIAADDQLVTGNHFSQQGRVLKPEGEVIGTPHIAESNSVAGYLIIAAPNLEGATKIAEKCPILNGTNTSVEIREITNPV